MSDHNLGNAWDLTHDPDHGINTYVLAGWLASRVRTRVETRVTYIISNGKLCSFTTGARSRGEWGLWVPYRGPNPHARHMHVSIRATARDDARPWFDVGFDKEAEVISTEDVARIAQEAARAVHGQKLGRSEITIGQALERTHGGMSTLVEQLGDPAVLATAIVAELLEELADTTLDTAMVEAAVRKVLREGVG